MSTSSFYTGGETPQTNVYEDEAKVYAEAAEASAQDAASSASAAATSAGEASAKALDADNAADAAVSAKNTAETKAAEATAAAAGVASSAASASGSATAAATSATNAANSASAAATSATNAAASAATATTKAGDATTAATTATTKASEASTSATNAASSATTASAAATTATTKASEASTSATNAASSATTATTKASEASTSASNASTSATSAASSASAASTSASNAASSATSAASAQTAAESARDATLAAFDSFDDRYLGTKTSDPTLDNDGNALVAGALYFNSTVGVMKVYTGSAWVAAYVSAEGVLLQANNLSDLANAATARSNLGLATVAATGAYADLSGKPTNVSSFTNDSGYVTTAGARSAISVAGSLSYNSTTGVISFTDAVTSVAGKTGAVTLANTDVGLGNVENKSSATIRSEITSGNVTTALGYTPANKAGDTFSGAVKIGAAQTNPDNAPFQVSGVIEICNSAAQTHRTSLEVDGSTTYINSNQYYASGWQVFDTGKAPASIRLRSDNLSSTIAFHTSDTNSGEALERMRVTEAGNIGVGTSAPTNFGSTYRTLHVAGANTTNGGVFRTSNSDNSVVGDVFVDSSTLNIRAGSGTALALLTDNSTRAYITSGGNVGIGTSSPGGKLDVRGAVSVGGAADASLHINTVYGGNGRLTQMSPGSNSTNAFNIIAARNGGGSELWYSWGVDTSDQFRINQGVGFAATGMVLGNGYTWWYTTSNLDTVSYLPFQVKGGISIDTNTTSPASAMSFFNGQGSGTRVGWIGTSGSSTSFNTSSDERLKENITDAADAGALIDSIQVRQFDWKVNGEHQRYGMIAQELDAVFPEAVARGPTQEDTLAVDYSKLVPLLVKELQSVRARLAELEGAGQ